jgi:hypothetical protein
MKDTVEFTTPEEKRKAFNWYLDAIKKQKYGTYKAISERFGVPERTLRKYRSGEIKNVNPKLFERVRKSFKTLSKRYYYFVATIEVQSELATGTALTTLTEEAALGAIKRINDSQATSEMLYANYWRQNTKRKFSIEDFKEILEVAEKVEEMEMIFINEYNFLLDLVKELPKEDREKAEDLMMDIDF